MKEFWNERYASEEYVYGKEPNEFLARILPNLKPGNILFPCEGEGRNVVFAARHGWSATGVDWSEEGKKKAVDLAKQFDTRIEYKIGDVSNLEVELDLELESFDVVALVFAHFPEAHRRNIHTSLLKVLKPGGYIILEGFSKDHVEFQMKNPNAGGPKDPSMLFTKDMILADFAGLATEICEEVEVELKEGTFHNGKSSILRYLGKK